MGMNSGPGDTPVSSGDTTLWELALRLVPSRHGLGGPPPEPPRIWPGELPDSLPFQLPVLDHGRVIGSYGRGQQLTILIDTDRHPRDVTAFYIAQMRASGWTTPTAGQEPGGFVSSHFAHQAQAFLYRSEEGPALSISAEIGADTITHVTLTVNLDPASNPCRPPVDQRPYTMRQGPLIPSLEAPADCTLVPYGTGGGPDISTALATLSTRLDLAAIAAHYGRQLEQAGWEPNIAGTDGPVAWSAWSFADRAGRAAHGFLVITQEPGPDASYGLYLYARSSPATAGEE